MLTGIIPNGSRLPFGSEAKLEGTPDRMEARSPSCNNSGLLPCRALIARDAMMLR